MGFVAVLHQEGGCDYTIECGTLNVWLESTTKEDALEEVERRLRGDSDEDDYDHEAFPSHSDLSSVTLYEVKEVIKVDLNSIYKKIRAERVEKKKSAEKEKRRVEFERLKKEFNDEPCDEDDE